MTELAASLDAGYAPYRRPRRLARFWLQARRQPMGLVAAAVFAVLVLAAVAAPLIAPHDPFISDYNAVRASPSANHLLGTDEIGRDILSRVLYALRISLTVGVVSVLLGTTVGMAIGLVSGFAGGWVDLVLQRAVDIVMAFPALILALTIVSVMGAELRHTIIAIAVVFVPYAARTVRGSVIVTKPNPYIEAATVIGAHPARVMVRHILPNILAPIIIVASIQLANAIIVEASLSFLGLGTQPPEASLGTMLSSATKNTVRLMPWLIYGPGAAIALTVLSINLAGDALRDILDPKLARR